MKRIVAFAIVLCLFLCGCDKTAEITQEKDILDVFSQLDDDDIPSEYPVYINGTLIEQAPQKTVCLSQSLADIVAEMGYGSTIVGIGSYCVAPEGTNSPDDVGKPTQPDIDRIIELSPDILLTSTSIPNMDVMKLYEAGVTTVYIPYPRSVEEFGRIYGAVGMIYEGMFSGEEAGKEAFAPVSEALDKASEVNCGSFIYITEGLAAAGRSTLEDSVLSLFGTSITAEKNIYGYSPDMSFLSDEEPDIIFLNSSYSAEDIMEPEVLGKFSAVSGGRIISIDNSYFENPSGKIITLIKDIADKLSEQTTERGTDDEA